MTDTNVLQEVVDQYSYEYQPPADRNKVIAQLEQELSDSLSLELDHREQVAEKLTQFRTDRTVAKIDSLFKRIDMSFLTQLRLQDSYEVPVFAVFELSTVPAVFLNILPKFLLEKMSECRIWVTSTGGFKTDPLFLEDYLGDGVERIKSTVKRNASNSSRLVATFKVAFSGKIPAETRAKISMAQKMGLKVFIVSEAPQWSISEKRIPIPEDPLVIGFKGNEHWLIDKFDLTPTEAMVANECTS